LGEFKESLHKIRLIGIYFVYLYINIPIMKKLNMKKGSYTNYPFKKNQEIDGIIILENDFIFTEDRYFVKYKCKCGNIDYKRLSHLQKMKYKVCKKCSRTNKYPEQRKARNHFENNIHKQWIKNINLNLKRGNRILKNNLTSKDLYNQIVKQSFKCYYSGVELNVVDIFKRDSNGSIDRIDSDKDYTVDNIHWVYKPINIMKNELNSDVFIEMCDLISNFKR